MAGDFTLDLSLQVGKYDVQKLLGKGATGTVYLSVPGNRAGAGKVHVTVLNRKLEYKAVTSEPTLPTGSQVVVVWQLRQFALDAMWSVDLPAAIVPL